MHALAYHHFLSSLRCIIQTNLCCIRVCFLTFLRAILLSACFWVNMRFKVILMTHNFGWLYLVTIAARMINILLIVLWLIFTNIIQTLLCLRNTISCTYNPVMHTICCGLLHINWCCFTFGLSCLADWINFSHLNDLCFLTSLTLFWSMTTSTS